MDVSPTLVPTLHKLGIHGLKTATGSVSYLLLLGTEMQGTPGVTVTYLVDPTIFWQGTIIRNEPRASGRRLGVARLPYTGRVLTQSEVDGIRALLPIMVSISIANIPVTPAGGIQVNLYDDNDEN